jgi:hypothetical protein
MTFTVTQAFASDRASAIQLHQRSHEGKLEVTAKNVSGKPIIAYVVAATVNENSTHVFTGVFTNGDSLRDAASMEIGTLPSTRDV